MIQGPDAASLTFKTVATIRDTLRERTYAWRRDSVSGCLAAANP